VAEVGESSEEDQIYRLTYDGSVADEHGFVVMGGTTEPIEQALRQRYLPEQSLGEALGLAVSVLAADPTGGEPRDLGAGELGPGQLEVAVLDRGRPRRTFRRIVGPLLDRLLNEADPIYDVPDTDDPVPGPHDTLSGHSPRHEATNPQTQREHADGDDVEQTDDAEHADGDDVTEP